MPLSTIWMVVLFAILVWYVVVTAIVAIRGFNSIREMLKDLS